jgi:hypothetical protein
MIRRIMYGFCKKSLHNLQKDRAKAKLAMNPEK